MAVTHPEEARKKFEARIIEKQAIVRASLTKELQIGQMRKMDKMEFILEQLVTTRAAILVIFDDIVESRTTELRLYDKITETYEDIDKVMKLQERLVGKVL